MDVLVSPLSVRSALKFAAGPLPRPFLRLRATRRRRCTVRVGCAAGHERPAAQPAPQAAAALSRRHLGDATRHAAGWLPPPLSGGQQLCVRPAAV